MSTEDTKEATERREPKKPKFISYLWDTFDKPPAERRLLTKLDTAFISFGAVDRLGFGLYVGADSKQYYSQSDTAKILDTEP
ncbi:hypothetical protein TMatcc_001988 [Talaromyces marneffei ATCC 18224]